MTSCVIKIIFSNSNHTYYRSLGNAPANCKYTAKKFKLKEAKKYIDAWNKICINFKLRHRYEIEEIED